MQIVIDIPREQYSLIMQSHRSGVARFIDKEAMMYAIKNGTPLEKIRAEIASYGTNSGMLLALEIIDKYRGKE